MHSFEQVRYIKPGILFCNHIHLFISLAAPPAIVTGFIPPLESIRNSSERLISVTSGDSDNNLAFNPRLITIRGIEDPLVERVDDGTVIVRTLHIGCKGEGRPKSLISWYEVLPIDSADVSLVTTNRVAIDEIARDDVLITIPREGRSVLRVSLDPDNTDCRRYICEATNENGTALGAVDICPQCMLGLCVLNHSLTFITCSLIEQSFFCVVGCIHMLHAYTTALNQ